MRTRSRCGRQSTICCLKALFVLVYAIVFATVWSGITADGRVSVKINCIWSTRAIGPTDTVRIVHDVITICRLRMISYIWRQERERTLPKAQIHVYEVNGSGKPGPWVQECICFRLAKLFVISVALFKQILGEELVLSHFLVPGDEKKTIIKWKRPPFRRVAYSAPRDVCRCSICYGMTPIHYRGAKTTPKYGVGWLLPNFGIFVNMLPPTSRTPRNEIPALYAR